MDDSHEFHTPQICSNCWYQSERIVYNINGRCDTCGGVDFIDMGHDPDRTQELERPDLQDIPEEKPEIEQDELSQSAREKVQQQLEEMRGKKYPNPLRKPGFFKDE